jgi:hypothetical protein
LSLQMLYCEITENGLKKRLDQDGYSSRRGRIPLRRRMEPFQRSG